MFLKYKLLANLILLGLAIVLLQSKMGLLKDGVD